jgi:membrane-associated phospholipid phosphatase
LAHDTIPEGRDAPPEVRPGGAETFAGAVLVGWSILGAIAVRANPQPNAIDHWGFEWIARSLDSTTFLRATHLGSAPTLAIGSILAALICLRRDRWRALACVAGPFLCAVSVEYVFKPLVSRRFEGVLSYPSGNTADVAALATAWVVAVPARLRPVLLVIGSAAVGAIVVAVIGLRWHYPTDALAGVALGVGVVLLVDGVLHLGPGAYFAHRQAVPAGRSGRRM